MLTLGDIATEVAKVRQAIDQLSVAGHANHALASYAYGVCDNLIDSLNETAREIQNQVQEVGEEDGESDSGAAE